VTSRRKCDSGELLSARGRTGLRRLRKYKNRLPA
jgi:hypothetical protein